MVAKQDTCALTTSAERIARIASLNDAARRGEGNGRLLVTQGVLALAQGTLPVILRQVATFDTFTPDNDPYGEHDLSALEWQGVRLFWKIDRYSPDLQFGSADPADPSITTRVLTVMLAE